MASGSVPGVFNIGIVHNLYMDRSIFPLTWQQYKSEAGSLHG
ncbi:hypothetical protein CFter6_3423 [Collimonas fungivorans]|uniref:Uncharacterized protein n=1 Tax=Collimonas fungivorans TaxID=158899 RepID=A0A127PE24_9BURK|nr:hypothetical protein CFter6_3423 [Collimonas fungivorans]